QNLTDDPQRGLDFLEKIRLSSSIQDVEPTPPQLKTLHTCMKKVTEDLDGLRFNTAISALMVFINEAMTWPVKPRSVLSEFLILLQPFAPPLAEELLAKPAKIQNPKPRLAYQSSPTVDHALPA